ncbi:MAG: hypothetical protein MRERV_14c036 [Mycoplasmataceae bacterium RV_VA103A]|nr:MAG: hypothetical protein MRERV_14c036 [Mycoplasmataceae bacterium RV_VA103A]
MKSQKEENMLLGPFSLFRWSIWLFILWVCWAEFKRREN